MRDHKVEATGSPIKSIQSYSAKIVDKYYGLLAFATVMASPTLAWAADGGKGINEVAEGLKTHVTGVGKLAVTGMFLVGLFLMGAGLMRLKAAADAQGNQVKYSEGLWRLAIAAGLIGIPWLTGVLGATIGTTTPTVSPTSGF